ncbi:shikimate kinase [Pelosinus sp. UFO1]|uniref:shikimate kinase n=1 Tax=Pelosinus sp. UFO1 TaxID=484770 RepID=UPI0004D1E4A2|nr:shikimate kinase [Pelosinus sp. UFO1]AIF52345.1 Shikimate kinase [Pelosinus sp. UFO1]
MKNIVLIGMPGSGKSSIGAMVSEKLKTTFLDIDHYIEVKEQKKIPELFLSGEAYFRQIESNAVKELYRENSLVIATGGGIVTRPENMVLLRETGIIFYIERPLPMILASSDLTTRPLLAEDNNKIYTLHQERKHLYENYCHFRIPNHGILEKAAEQIVTIIKESQ